jgi:hypothetical protein
MKLSETPIEQREGHIAYVNKRWSQLSELELSWGADAVKYLLFVNSGAAVTVLTFIGTSEQIRALFWPKPMLGCFVLGVVFLGFYQAVRYHRIAHIYNEWRVGVDSYFNDQTDWNVLIADDDKRSFSGSLRFQILLAYVSFACFLSGVAIGMFKFVDLA